MSDSSGDILRYGNTEYVQNPVDDLQSFMWTALWETVFNRRALSPGFKQWSSMLEELYLFYQFALEGVAGYAELLYEQREQLQALQ